MRLDDILADVDALPVSRDVDLGSASLRVRSDDPGFGGYQLFCGYDGDLRGPVYQVDCVDLNRHADIDIRHALDLADPSFRAGRFRRGSYMNHQFGRPAALITRGRRLIIVGHDIEKILWSYVVKYVLTVESIRTGALHLKAAAFTNHDHQATLLIGRGSAGKSVFLTRMCLDGGRLFLTNSHALLAQGVVTGVPSTIRVRPGAAFDELIRASGSRAHLYQDEYAVDPSVVFPGTTTYGTLASVCIVDYRPDRPSEVTLVPADVAYEFAEQFAFPIVTYGLKEDLIHYLGGDLGRFAAVMTEMKERIKELVTTLPVIYANLDMLRAGAVDEVTAALTGAPAPAGRA